MQLTVWTDEINYKLFNDPDKTFMIRLLLLFKNTAPFLALMIIYGDLADIVLVVFWGILLYNTEKGRKAFDLFIYYYSMFLEVLNFLIIPLVRAGDYLYKLFYNDHIEEAKRPRRSSSIYLETYKSRGEFPHIEPIAHRAIKQKVFISYENQRWWIGLGFCDKLFLGERPTWSDDLGQIKLIKEGFKLPGVTWKWEAPWHLVLDPHTDKKGWEYASSFDDFNKRGKPDPILKIVRRRKWVRRCIEVQDSKI